MCMEGEEKDNQYRALQPGILRTIWYTIDLQKMWEWNAHPAEAHPAAEALGGRAEIIYVLPISYGTVPSGTRYLIPQYKKYQQKMCA